MNAIYIYKLPRPVIYDYFPMHNYQVIYLLTSMPGNNVIKLWCKDGMVRAIVMVRDGVLTRDALMRHISKGH